MRSLFPIIHRWKCWYSALTQSLTLRSAGLNCSRDYSKRNNWWKYETMTMTSKLHDCEKSESRDSTMVKTRYNFVFPPSYYRVFTIVVSLVPFSTFHYHTIAFLPPYFRDFIIVLSCFHNRTIAFSPSYYQVLTIVISCFHYRVPRWP